MAYFASLAFLVLLSAAPSRAFAEKPYRRPLAPDPAARHGRTCVLDDIGDYCELHEDADPRIGAECRCNKIIGRVQ